MVKKFLRFLAGDNQQQPDQQLSLTQDGQPLASSSQRLNNAVVYRKFSDAISDAGGSELAYPKAVTAETEELFVQTASVIQGGWRKSKRPLDVADRSSGGLSSIRDQSVVATTPGGDAQDLQTQDEKDRYIVETVRQAAKETRNDAPW